MAGVNIKVRASLGVSEKTVEVDLSALTVQVPRAELARAVRALASNSKLSG